ncbi:MAG: hypothetical protein JNK53_04365 [Phycisphaerae bacterium]|nr:hypothetical protein [Phycisphaerae bacterium]
MSHQSHEHDRGHSKAHHSGKGGGRGFSVGHVLKLLLLNCVLFLACGAFAGAIVGDYIPDKMQLRVIGAFVLVPLGIAIVSTVVHVYSARWTSVDSMSERMFGGKPGPGQ